MPRQMQVAARSAKKRTKKSTTTAASNQARRCTLRRAVNLAKLERKRMLEPSHNLRAHRRQQTPVASVAKPAPRQTLEVKHRHLWRQKAHLLHRTPEDAPREPQPL